MSGASSLEIRNRQGFAEKKGCKDQDFETEPNKPGVEVRSKSVLFDI